MPNSGFVQARTEVPIEGPNVNPVSQTFQNGALASPAMAPLAVTPTRKKPTATVILYVALFAVPIVLGILHMAVLGPPGAWALLLLSSAWRSSDISRASRTTQAKGRWIFGRCFVNKYKAVSVGALVATLLIGCLAVVTGIATNCAQSIGDRNGGNRTLPLSNCMGEARRKRKGIGERRSIEQIQEATQSCKVLKDAGFQGTCGRRRHP